MSNRDEWIENRPDLELATRAREVEALLMSGQPINRIYLAGLKGEWASIVAETTRRGWPSPTRPPQGELFG